MSTTTNDLDRASANGGTGAAMMTWFEHILKRNEISEATGSGLRTGTRKVLGVEDNWPNLDLRTLDVEDLVRRYRIATRGEISDASVDEYERRFRNSLDMYRKWLNDEDWHPKSRKAAATPRRQTPGPSTSLREATANSTPAAERADAPAAHGMTTYPFNVRPGVQARLVLPDDLTAAEARRVSSFVASIAFPDEVQDVDA